MKPHFKDREDAGAQLGARLRRHLGEVPSDSIVTLGLPRGGVPVARQVALALGTPLDVVIVRKVGVPGDPELAMGAVGERGVVALNDDVVRLFDVTPAVIRVAVDREQIEIGRRVIAYRGERSLENLTNKTVVIVDDGLATGATAKAACEIVRKYDPAHIVLAVPVAPRGWEKAFVNLADDCIALHKPSDFRSVGEWYVRFNEVSDADVRDLLHRPPSAGKEVRIVLRESAALRGYLHVPEGADTIVLFVHGQGSDSKSPRSQKLAQYLSAAGYATLLFDLTTTQEAEYRNSQFDLNKFVDRVCEVVDWCAQEKETSYLRIVLFGASTGGGISVLAATKRPDSVEAVITRGGRVDLVESQGQKISCPLLMIVGSRDREVLEINRRYAQRLKGLAHVATVTDASHLFEEPGAMDEVARQATTFMQKHLPD